MQTTAPSGQISSAFLQALLNSPPGTPLDALYESCTGREADLRRLWAADRENPRLSDPHVGLHDVFASPTTVSELYQTRARSVSDDVDLHAKHVMALPPDVRRENGVLSVVETSGEFKRNFALFTEGALGQILDWSKMVVAGGCVQACLTPLSADLDTDLSRRQWYHKTKYPVSDVDIFLYDMTEEEAMDKIVQIYAAIRQAIPVEVACVVTPHTLTIHSQYPYRPIQIIRRIYQSPAEVLAGFDIDSVACLYNGETVLASERWILATVAQVNTIDVSRRSPSYEFRLAKYRERGFEVKVPFLDRPRIDPSIYTRNIGQAQGLSRLLLLERSFEDRRQAQAQGDEAAGNSQIGSIRTPQVPYGPGWTARRIKDSSRVSNVEVGNSSTHEDVALGDKSTRISAEALRDTQFIRSRVTFFDVQDIHRNMLPSETSLAARIEAWSSNVYVNDGGQFFGSIASHDIATLRKVIRYDGFDINQRDEEGRSGLHLAIMLKAENIATILIENGIQVSLLTPGGRNALHLAARLNMASVISQIVGREPVQLRGSTTSITAHLPDIEVRDTEFGLTPLGQAIFWGSEECIEVLWKAGASINNVRLGDATELYLVNVVSLGELTDSRRSLAAPGSSPANNVAPGPPVVTVLNARRKKVYCLSRSTAAGLRMVDGPSISTEVV